MEPETQESETPESEIFKVDIIYFINNENQKEGKMELLNFDNNFNDISYNEIAHSFYYFLEEKGNNYFLDEEYKQIDINFIRYFDGEGWILLEEDETILLEGALNFCNIKFMIKANILIGLKQKNINNYFSIVNKIKNIQDDLWGDRKNIPPDAPLNLIVLTANPLMDGEKELRTMNDFNIIPSKIYELLDEYQYLTYTEFLPLTINTLKDIVSNEEKRPVILHLICKSTYDNQIANLIFEQDEDNKNKSKYNLEFINKEKLETIFNSNEKIKKNIKKITLIISTPLAEDVYDLFNNFGFRNLFVQHTTLADVNYIAEFNYQFYFKLINKQPISINEIYNNINIYMNKENPPSFCCCCHKHKKDCKLITNLKNELYNDNTNYNNNNINKLYLEKTIPHFYHLFPSCQTTCYNIINNSSNPNYSLSIHSKRCLKTSYFENENENHKKIEDKDIKGEFFNLCCCSNIIAEKTKEKKEGNDEQHVLKDEAEHNTLKEKEEQNTIKKEHEQHTLNTIFFKNFNKEDKILFRIEDFMGKKKFVPNFSEMKLLVGQNKIVLKVIEFIDSDKLYNYYIQGNNIESLQLFGNIIKEYYKEKNYYYNDEPDDLEELNLNLNMLKKMNSIEVPDINQGYDDLSNDNINIVWTKSSPNIQNFKRTKKIEIFDLKDKKNNENIISEFNEKIINGDNNNKIYFIFVFNNSLVKEAKLKINEKKIKIIWFYKDELEDKDMIENENKVEFNYEPKLKEEMYKNVENKEKIKISPNLYIQFQNKKDVRNKWRRNEIFK